MKQRFILYRRKRGGMFYVEDAESRKQESLGTKNRAEALALLNARNEAVRQPPLNLHIARTYLAASDPGAIKRPWRVPLEEIGKNKRGATRARWLSVLKDEAFELIRDLPLLETRPEHLLKVMEVGTVSTNVFLRRVHNFALDMGWLPWPVIPKKHWPRIHFCEKRAITLAEHQAILTHESNPDRKAFYQLCWLLGASQSDLAFLEAGNVDWAIRVISFARQKTQTVSMIHFGDEVEAVLRTLPATGPFFPKLRPLNSGHRATEFTRVCHRAGVKGVTLHSYRYAWAERAKQCGYPERFAQEALGHNSQAVHRAYSRKAKVKLPSLENYEKQGSSGNVIPFQSAHLLPGERQSSLPQGQLA
jgi:integrase